MEGISDGVALVTGGASGIGRATAEAFAGEGARVVVADVDVDGGQETVDRIDRAGGDAAFVHADVSRANDAENAVETAVERYGGLDFAHNNAGVGARNLAPVADRSEADWDRILEVNLKGVWLGLKYQAPAIVDGGGGAIVNTSSVSGLTSVHPGMTPENASKHGVTGLTRTVALEYASEGLRVNAVCPTVVETAAVEEAPAERRREWIESVPMGRMCSPEEVADAVVWLCSSGASFVTGHALPVDGGRLLR